MLIVRWEGEKDGWLDGGVASAPLVIEKAVLQVFTDGIGNQLGPLQRYVMDAVFHPDGFAARK